MRARARDTAAKAALVGAPTLVGCRGETANELVHTTEQVAEAVDALARVAIGAAIVLPILAGVLVALVLMWRSWRQWDDTSD